MTPTPSSTPEPKARLGTRFLVVWLGQTMSAVGSIMTGVGVAVWAFFETGDATWLGALTAAAALPYIITVPLVGWVDRLPRRTVMILADTFAAIGPAVALGLVVAGRIEIWHLVVTAFIGGVGNSLQVPAWQAAVPSLVTPEALGRANGLNQLGPAVGVVVGPIAATPLVAWWGIEAVLSVDLATFAAAVVTTALTRFADEPAEPIADDDGRWGSAWRWLVTDGRALLVLLVLMASVNLSLAFFNVSMAALATSVAGVGRAGFVFAAGGAAMIAGSLAVSQRGVTDDRIRTFSTALVLIGIGCFVTASRPTLALVLVGTVLALLAVPGAGAAVATIFHEQVPPSMLGRVFGIRTSISRLLEPVGSLTAGWLIAHVADPAMAADGGLAPSLGSLIGTGPTRGPALVLIAAGVGLVLLGLWTRRSWIGPVLAKASADDDGSVVVDEASPAEPDGQQEPDLIVEEPVGDERVGLHRGGIVEGAE